MRTRYVPILYSDSTQCQTINGTEYTSKLLKLATRLQKASKEGRLNSSDAEVA